MVLAFLILCDYKAIRSVVIDIYFSGPKVLPGRHHSFSQLLVIWIQQSVDVASVLAVYIGEASENGEAPVCMVPEFSCF